MCLAIVVPIFLKINYHFKSHCSLYTQYVNQQKIRPNYYSTHNLKCIEMKHACVTALHFKADSSGVMIHIHMKLVWIIKRI